MNLLVGEKTREEGSDEARTTGRNSSVTHESERPRGVPFRSSLGTMGVPKQGEWDKRRVREQSPFRQEPWEFQRRPAESGGGGNSREDGQPNGIVKYRITFSFTQMLGSLRRKRKAMTSPAGDTSSWSEKNQSTSFEYRILI